MHHHKILTLLLTLSLLTACSWKRQKLQTQQAAVTTNQDRLDEESRALTTGASDALSYAPRIPPTDLARDLLARDQQIEGMPMLRIDAAGILASNQQAMATLKNRYTTQDSLLQERNQLTSELEMTRSALVELGKKYEGEKNQSTIRKVWKWALGTLGIGGMIALVIFFPAILPILGGIVGWIVKMLPGVAKWIGLVGTKAFDGVVKGVGTIRERLKKDPEKTYTGKEALAMMDNELQSSLDNDLKRPGGLIESRRDVLRV